MSFRYYLYISDTKVDMLLPQIDPGFARQRESEVSVGLKVVAGSRRVIEPSPERVSRLDRVVEYLDEYGDVGTFDEPGPFFAGTLPMRMLTSYGDTVYFGGGTARTEVGIGGSMAHLLGAAPPPAGAVGSHMPGIIGALEQIVPTEPEDQWPEPTDDTRTPTLVRDVNSTLRGPVQRVEVLAKRLFFGPVPETDTMALLGTPLYVALVD